MTDSILWRLVWKEYRVLRGFWLCLAAFGVVLLPLSQFSDHPPTRLAVLVGIIAMMPAFYLLGSTAVSFAAEREDGTDQLLQRLGVPRGRLWLSKLAFDLISTLLLAGVLCLAAQALSFSSLLANQNSGEIRSTIANWLAWGVCFFGWGVFFSLVCRRVLSVVCLTALASLLTPFVTDGLIRLLPGVLPIRHDPQRWDAIDWNFRLVALPLLLLLESYRVTRLWVDDRGWRLPAWIARIGRVVASRVGVLPPFRSGAAATSTAKPIALPRPLVHESAPPWKRELKRLIWLEWRTARWVTLGVLVVVGGVLILSQRGGPSRVQAAGLLLTLLVLASAVFGLVSYSHEQGGRRFRWLTDQGLSPSQVWCVKHLVWLSAAIGCFVVLASIAAMTCRPFYYHEATVVSRVVVPPGSDSIGETFAQIVAAIGQTPLRPDSAHPGFALTPSLAESAPRCLLLVCLCYAAGHFVSILIPRTITAIFLGWVACGAVFAWWITMNGLAIPLTLSVVPWLPTLLLATWLFANDWMFDRRSWRVYVRPLGVCVVGFAVTAAYAIWFRVTEIPESPRVAELTSRLTPPASPAALDAGRQLSLAAPQSTPEPSYLARGMRDRHELTTHSSVVRLEWSPLTTEWQSWLERNVAPLRASMDVLQRGVAPLIEYKTIGQPAREYGQYLVHPAVGDRVFWLLATSARQLEAEGRLSEAFDRYLLNLRCAELCSRDGSQRDAEHGLAMVDHTIECLARWAAHPDQTPESLRAALRRYRTFVLMHYAANPSEKVWKDFFDGKVEAKTPPSWMLERIVHPEGKADERQSVPLASTGQHALLPDLRDAIAVDHRLAVAQLGSDTPDLSTNLSRRLFPWEQIRERRLVDYLAVHALDEIGSVPVSQPRVNLAAEFHRRGWDRQPDWYAEPTHGQQWVLTTASAWQAGMFYSNLRDLPHVLRHRIDTETRLRAFTLMLALAAYKLEHGDYPERLADLPDELRWSADGSDPWTGRDFDYRPHGFPMPLVGKDLTVPAKQPLLQSPGLLEFPLEPPTQWSGHPEPKWTAEFRSGWDASAWSSEHPRVPTVQHLPLLFPLP